ncbi:MAG TPA: hypothetical protein VKU00_06800 [Chthonomonadaceae bacterium]|nr:hypothetical protein [Chthonomonadaceae bacterium]
MRRLLTPAEVEMVATSGDPYTIPKLLHALQNPDPHICDTAFEALRRFGEAAFQAMVGALLSGNVKQRAAMAAYLGDWNDERAVWPLLSALDRAERERGVPIPVGFLGCLMPIPALILYVLIKVGVLPVFQDGRRVVRHAAWSLGKLGDVRTVGKLAQLVMTSQGAEWSGDARTALAQVLPKVRGLTPDQAYVLGPNAVVAMAHLLSLPDTGLRKELLGALAAVGDGRAAPAVHRLLQTLPPSSELRQHAETTLAILAERAAREEARMTLLRGSEAGAPPDQLLRAAYGQTNSAEAPQQLLRAASPTELE